MKLSDGDALVADEELCGGVVGLIDGGEAGEGLVAAGEKNILILPVPSISLAWSASKAAQPPGYDFPMRSHLAQMPMNGSRCVCGWICCHGRVDG